MVIANSSKQPGKPGNTLFSAAIGCLTAISLSGGLQALAENVDEKNKSARPAGTLLLPMTPKLDGAATPSAIAPPAPASLSSSSAATPKVLPPAPRVPASGRSQKQPRTSFAASAAPAAADCATPQAATIAPAAIVDELGSARPLAGPVPVSADASPSQAEPLDEIDAELAKIPVEADNMLLKGTVQIIADDTEYDQEHNTFLGTGNAVATIAGQDSRLEADMILYDQTSQTIDARGNVKILREGQVSTGSAFKFKVGADEYLITDPDTEIAGTQVIARVGYGSRQGMGFKDGTLSLPQAVQIARNPFNGTLQSYEDTFAKALHPDAYIPQNPSFTFTARKMVYERYKDSGNLTVFGGKLKFKHFTVPLGKFTTTVGQDSQVTFPVTPLLGNNIQVGGMNIGPSFNSAVGKSGRFSWAPLLQMGGRQANAQSNSGKYGAGFRLSYQGRRLSSNLAYGSVSNLLVGDVRYIINQRTSFQAGVNRFLPDGIFGTRRARAIAEFVDWRGIGGIPFLQGVAVRTSAGWASDQPSLVTLTPQYAKLFNKTTGNITSGYRLQEQLMTTSEPIFNIGDRKYGASMNVFGGVAARAYSTGDAMLMGQVGPVLNVNLNRVRLQGQVVKSGVQGQSPFVFDQFIQGSKSANISGDVKLSKWLTVGGSLGYNMNAKLLYQRSVSAAIGPGDFKILLTRDTIRGINNFGFDVLYGQPVQFKKLVMKGTPDYGQLGGI